MDYFILNNFDNVKDELKELQLKYKQNKTKQLKEKIQYLQYILDSNVNLIILNGIPFRWSFNDWKYLKEIGQL